MGLGRRGVMSKRGITALLLAGLLFYTNFLAKALASIYNPDPKFAELVSKKLKPLSSVPGDEEPWVRAKSNSNFAFREIQLDKKRVLQLKNLRSKNIYNLYKSSLVEDFSSIRDVSPNGKVVVFEANDSLVGGNLYQTYVMAFNRDYGLTLSDGVLHKAESIRRLTKITFKKDKQVEIAYADHKGHNQTVKTIKLEKDFSLDQQVSSALDAIKYFYGGEFVLGTEIKTVEKDKVYEINFDPKYFQATNIAKHKIHYDANSKTVVAVEEYDAANNLVRKANFNYNGYNYLAEIFDPNNVLVYRKISLNKPMVSGLGDYMYLKAELNEFYGMVIPSAVKITIDDNEVAVDWGELATLPLHKLRFARTFDRYSNYGFGSIEETSRDQILSRIFIVPASSDKITAYQKYKGKIEEIRLTSGGRPSRKILAEEMPQIIVKN